MTITLTRTYRIDQVPNEANWVVFEWNADRGWWNGLTRFETEAQAIAFVNARG